MASFIDIFNPSFFMFLGIVVLVAALLIVYFESKMREQNHKISSMFSLVTAITDELNSVKMIALSGGGGTRPNYIPDDGPKLEESMPVIKIRNDEAITLIEVSDDDTDDEDEEDEEDEDDSGSSDSESESDEVKEPPEIIEIGDLKSSNIKILNVNMMSSNSQSFWAAAASEIIECDFEDGIDEIDADSFSSESSSESGDDSDAILVMEEIMVIKGEPKVEEQAELEPPEPEIIDLTEDNEDEPDAIIASPEIKIEPGTFNQLDLELKTIHISNLEEPTPFDSAVIDYTKASLNKLRQIVVMKGLVEDSSKSSKLKKGELLKLLGVSE